MGRFIDEADAKAIEAAIGAAEARTRAELVAVVAPESDDYRYVALSLAAILGLAAPFPWSLELVEGPAYMGHAAALVTFLLVLGLCWIDPVRRLVTPGSLMRRRAARHARMQFFAQKVRMTRDRAGVLLFVSVFEHHVEIIADDAAAAAVPQATWDEAIAAFTAALKRETPAAGFLAAIAVLDAALAEHLPGDGRDPDELPNRLIVL